MKLIFQIFVLLSFIIFIQCQSLRKSHIIVTTILDPPYMMMRESPQTNLTGNDRFEGYVVDLLDAISKVLDFNYVLKVSDAGTYGWKDNTGKWNGLVGDLIDGRTQIAAGAITITDERESVIDFTVPFMNLGISILYKKGEVIGRTIVDDFNWLLEPFKNYITDVFLILTFIFGIILILLRRKYKTVVFRILLGFWLLFLFFFASLFIAQLSSYYHLYGDVKYIINDIASVNDLAAQSHVAYGCIQGGSTQSFFRNSKVPMYSKMWYNMESRDPTAFVRNSTEGVERVSKGGYAFFSESTMIEYVVSRYCDLQQIGGLLDSKGYGLAVQQGSYIRETLNHAILVLQEQGTLSELKNKWWFEKNGGGTC